MLNNLHWFIEFFIKSPMKHIRKGCNIGCKANRTMSSYTSQSVSSSHLPTTSNMLGPCSQAACPFSALAFFTFFLWGNTESLSVNFLNNITTQTENNHISKYKSYQKSLIIFRDTVTQTAASHGSKLLNEPLLLDSSRGRQAVFQLFDDWVSTCSSSLLLHFLSFFLSITLLLDFFFASLPLFLLLMSSFLGWGLLSLSLSLL